MQKLVDKNFDATKKLGDDMFSWAKDLFPLCRSITGLGFRQTLDYLSKILPGMHIKAVPSGTRVFDWIVPDEWNIKDAFIQDEAGKIYVDFQSHNLHVVGYSVPIDVWMTYEELQPHLHSIPSKPDTIPYVTSYYTKAWGFCLTENQRRALPRDGRLHVVINSSLQSGELNYGEYVLPGLEEKEVFVSTYLCHPSMANNELSGPVVSAALAQWIGHLKQRRYTYRFIFIPETIGSIVYLAKHHQNLKENVIAGFNITCVGDDRAYSFLPSRLGNTLSDKVALHAMKSRGVSFTSYSFLDRGSDERQYCWPGIDLPIVSIMRSKYATYPEYHTSDDDLTLVTPSGLLGSLTLYLDCVKMLEANKIYRCKVLCEPNLGKRGLYPLLSNLENKRFSRDLIDFLVYCDGEMTVLDIAIKLEKSIDQISSIIEILQEADLIEEKFM